MTEADRLFRRFPPFIREYIYSHGWESLREAQLNAARVLLESEDNLLLAGATASGKTEAAFFPILADLYNILKLAKSYSFIILLGPICLSKYRRTI